MSHVPAKSTFQETRYCFPVVSIPPYCTTTCRKLNFMELHAQCRSSFCTPSEVKIWFPSDWDHFWEALKCHRNSSLMHELKNQAEIPIWITAKITTKTWSYVSGLKLTVAILKGSSSRPGQCLCHHWNKYICCKVTTLTNSTHGCLLRIEYQKIIILPS